MGGCVGGAAAFTLYAVGITTAIAAVLEVGDGEPGQAVIFGVVAWLCWLGIKKVTGADSP